MAFLYSGNKISFAFGVVALWIMYTKSPSATHLHGLLTRYVKLWVVHAPGMEWTFSPPLLQRKPLVSEFGMHVSWCMLGSITSGGGENVPGIPSVCVTRNFTYQARGPWRLNFEVIFGKVHNIFQYDQRMYFMCSKCVKIPCIWFAWQELRFAN